MAESWSVGLKESELAQEEEKESKAAEKLKEGKKTQSKDNKEGGNMESGKIQTETEKERAWSKIENNKTQETRNNEGTIEKGQNKINDRLGQIQPYVVKET